MYNTFEGHFKPNQKSQSDMVDPVIDNFFLKKAKTTQYYKMFWKQKYFSKTLPCLLRMSEI